jgi:hypothetical protein
MSKLYHDDRTLRKILRNASLFLLIIVPSSYGLFRAHPLIVGPQITVISPQDGESVASTTFQISGTVKRSTAIYLQGKPITVNEKGAFTETLIAVPPYTILVLVATDKYGATTTKTLRVIPKKY